MMHTTLQNAYPRRLPHNREIWKNECSRVEVVRWSVRRVSILTFRPNDKGSINSISARRHTNAIWRACVSALCSDMAQRNRKAKRIMCAPKGSLSFSTYPTTNLDMLYLVWLPFRILHHATARFVSSPQNCCNIFACIWKCRTLRESETRKEREKRDSREKQGKH